jgi:hypothetical protein
MIRMLGVCLLLAACLSPAYGQAKKTAASSAADAVKQLEKDWGAAQLTEDLERLGQILADDWAGIGPDGNKMTKAEFLNNVKTGKSKLEAFEPGPMDAKVIGSVAVVQGSDKETSSFDGKNTSGKYVWMDVFVLRAGKWQVVRSQSALAK